MKQVSRDIAHPAFAYCKKHNRLFLHWSVGWLTPMSIEGLHTFYARCDECKKDTGCPWTPSLRSTTALAVKAR